MTCWLLPLPHPHLLPVSSPKWGLNQWPPHPGRCSYLVQGRNVSSLDSCSNLPPPARAPSTGTSLCTAGEALLTHKSRLPLLYRLSVTYGIKPKFLPSVYIFNPPHTICSPTWGSSSPTRPRAPAKWSVSTSHSDWLPSAQNALFWLSLGTTFSRKPPPGWLNALCVLLQWQQPLPALSVLCVFPPADCMVP